MKLLLFTESTLYLSLVIQFNVDIDNYRIVLYKYNYMFSLENCVCVVYRMFLSLNLMFAMI